MSPALTPEQVAKLADEFPELNPNNCNEDDVLRLNNWGIEVHDAIRALLTPQREGR